jgi:hypothetical protein
MVTVGVVSFFSGDIGMVDLLWMEQRRLTGRKGVRPIPKIATGSWTGGA